MRCKSVGADYGFSKSAGSGGDKYACVDNSLDGYVRNCKSYVKPSFADADAINADANKNCCVCKEGF